MAYYSGIFRSRGICVHIRGVSPIQWAGLEGFHCKLQGPNNIHVSNMSLTLLYICSIYRIFCMAPSLV